MSDNTDKQKKPAAKKRQAGRRPATIELEATEVNEDASASTQGNPDAASAKDSVSNEAGASATDAAGKSGAKTDNAPGTEAHDDNQAGSPPPHEARRPARSGMPILAVIAAAVAGAVVALAGYAGLERAGIWRAQTVSSVEPARLDALADDIDALRAEIDRSADDTGLASRLDALEARIGELARSGTAAVPPDVEKLEQRIAGAEAQLTLLRSEQTNLLERLQAVGGDSGAAAAVAALGERVDTLETDLRENSATMAARAGELDALKERLATAQGTLDKVATQRPQADARAALAIAIAGLERAVAAGQPFARELDVVRELAGQRSEIDVLRPMAEKGVARLDELTRTFDDAASRALAASNPSGGGDLVNRLLSGARDIVRVRPTDEVEGQDAGAVLARAEARLRDGDVLGATQELAALDEAAQQAMASWTTRARQRLTALRQVQALSESAMNALRGAPAERAR